MREYLRQFGVFAAPARGWLALLLIVLLAAPPVQWVGTHSHSAPRKQPRTSAIAKVKMRVAVAAFPHSSSRGELKSLASAKCLTASTLNLRRASGNDSSQRVFRPLRC